MFVQANNLQRVSPAFLAAGASAEVLRLLMQAGTSVRILDKARWSWVYILSYLSKLYPTSQSHNLCALFHSTHRQSLLHAAARSGNVASMKVLIEEYGKFTILIMMSFARIFCTLSWWSIFLFCCTVAGIDINGWDRWSRTALHWCVLNNHPAAAQYLIQQGVDVSPQLSARWEAYLLVGFWKFHYILILSVGNFSSLELLSSHIFWPSLSFLLCYWFRQHKLRTVRYSASMTNFSLFCICSDPMHLNTSSQLFRFNEAG